MLRLSRMTDYAVVILTQMGRDPRALHTTQQLADSTAVPAPTVAKLLKMLVRDGLAVSHRGAAGGYSLTRSPENIAVAEVIAAVDGPIALTACVDGATGSCTVEHLCPLRGNWNKVNSAVRNALEQVSLADMMAPPAFAVGLDRPERVDAKRAAG